MFLLRSAKVLYVAAATSDNLCCPSKILFILDSSVVDMTVNESNKILF